MKVRLLAIAAVATAFAAATPLWAFPHGGQVQAAPDKKSKGPHPSKWDVTLTIQYNVGGTSGPCTGGEGNADACLSGDCTCYSAAGFAKGTTGKGDVELFETFDNGGEFIEFASACGPVYGDIEISGTKDTESISFVGSDCFSEVTADLLSGGCQLTDSVKFHDAGLATCAGNISNSNPTTFKISGAAE